MKGGGWICLTDIQDIIIGAGQGSFDRDEVMAGGAAISERGRWFNREVQLNPGRIGRDSDGTKNTAFGLKFDGLAGRDAPSGP